MQDNDLVPFIVKSPFYWESNKEECQPLLPMYGSGLFYNRYRSAYDEGDRRRSVRSPGDSSWTYTPSPWAVRSSIVKNTDTGTSVKTHLNKCNSINKRLVDDYSMANNSNQTNTPARRTRYSRSSTTTSVAQLLSDSCSSLLQKLTTRVRGPSATVERQLINNNSSSRGQPNPLTTSKSSTFVPNFGMTKSRIEDKYSNVLDRIYRRKESEKNVDPPIGRYPLSKSSTTANVILSEKAYPYVSNVTQREKTPFKNDRNSMHKRHYPEPQYTYLDGESSYRVRHRSNHSELRPRRSSKPHRTGKSEVNDRKPTTNLKLCPVEIKLHEDPVPIHSVPSEASRKNELQHQNSAVSITDPILDREAKRKEIQSLIMKYSALDEAYNKVKPPDTSPSGTTSASTSANVPPSVSSAISVTASITQKYYPNLFAAVSSKSRGVV